MTEDQVKYSKVEGEGRKNDHKTQGIGWREAW